MQSQNIENKPLLEIKERGKDGTIVEGNKKKLAIDDLGWSEEEIK